MGQQRGWKSTLVIDPETTFGADPATPSGQIIPIDVHSLKLQQTLVVPETMKGRRDQSAPQAGTQVVQGDITGPLELGNLGFVLEMAFGQASSPWSVADDQASFVIEDTLPDVPKFIKYNGCKVNSLGLNFVPNQELQYKLGIIGQKQTAGDTAYDASAAAAAAIVPVTFNHLALSEGGNPLPMKAMTLNVEMGLDAEQFVTGAGGLLGALGEGLVKVSGQLTLLLDSYAVWTKAVAGTETSLVLVATVGAQVLTITLSEVRLEQPTKDLQGPKGRLLVLPYQAYFDDASPDVSLIQVTLA